MSFRSRPLYAICAVAIIAAAAVTARQAIWRTGLAEMRVKGTDQLALHRDGLEAAIERYRYLPFLLAQDSVIRGLLKQPVDGELIEAANRYLDRANRAAGASALYVMNRSGLTLAASNSAEPTSFVGHSYAFRPYFQDALKNGEGRFYAIGVTTNEPGYFLSHIIEDGGEAIGVAVVKVDLRPLERAWREAGETVAVLDGSGIAFLASIDDWKYRPLHPLGPEQQAKLAASRQYSGANLLSRSLIQGGHGVPVGDLVSVRSLSGIRQPPSVLFHGLPLKDHGWTLVATNSIAPLTERANLVAAVVALTLAFLMLIGLLLRQRRQMIRAKLEAHASLERRVDERTRELQQLNCELAREIDVRHRAEEELRHTQEELIQAAKLAALGQMSAAIVHEVSQPLTALETYLASTRLLLRNGSSEAVGANVEIISDLVARMRRMARSLKAFARKEEVGEERIELRMALDNAISLLRPRFDAEKIVFSIEDSAASTAVLMNGIRAEQVLINLIGNAMDAVKGVETKSISVRLENADGFVRLSVADSGVGIPEHLHDRIREPFFSSKKAGEGLGLGLFICEAIINDAGGALSFSHGAKGGAVFRVILPLYGAERRRAAE